ncbi:hypothetical protein [Haloglycomyces albus]|uniref:hypothetical protein n=1 Tax=Haloglycomyces albus TaxID=526067 RepID=UPI00046C95B7|nr:hypothetical protein [Haloglycomyces albus]
MDVLQLILRYIHLLGFAALVGGWLAAVFAKKFTINFAMLLGVAVQLVTGIFLTGLAGSDADHMKIGIKAVLAVLLAVMVIIPWWKKRDPVNSGHFYAIGGLALVTVGVAVFM